jgi:hypothetical protein
MSTFFYDAVELDCILVNINRKTYAISFVCYYCDGKIPVVKVFSNLFFATQVDCITLNKNRSLNFYYVIWWNMSKNDVFDNYNSIHLIVVALILRNMSHLSFILLTCKIHDQARFLEFTKPGNTNERDKWKEWRNYNKLYIVLQIGGIIVWIILTTMTDLYFIKWC